jgi:ribosomal protein S18 acetylase RimI-like enzyme
MAVGDSPFDVQLFRPSVDLPSRGQQLWVMLNTVDHEFVPPLSARTEDALQMDGRPAPGGPVAVFDLVMSEYVLFAHVEGEIAGFLSFRPHERSVMLPLHSPCTYVTCLATLPHYRCDELTTALNEAVERLPLAHTSPWITRRTWSTDDRNIELLLERGYEEVLRLPNHRGQGIDTVYFSLPTPN